MHKFVAAILCPNAQRNQNDYLKNTAKPENMAVKQWTNRVLNINSYIPLMLKNAKPFSKEDLISEVISRNIPEAWMKDFEFSTLHLRTKISDKTTDLTIIKARVKVQHRH
jgi:hypothetical protein